MLLCDIDHGLVHDHDLVLSRRNGRLTVLTPDGRHIWGTTDAAFHTGLAGMNADTHRIADVAGDSDPFLGVHPIDDAAGRRPTDIPPANQHRESDPPLGRPVPRRSDPPRRRRRRPGQRRAVAPAGHALPGGCPPGRTARRAALPAASPAGPARDAARLSRILFPDGEPPLPDSQQQQHDRMDLRWAIAVLMGNRDLTRRLAAEAGLPADG